MRKPRSPRRPGDDPAAPPRLLQSPRATLFFFGAIGLLLWGRLLLKEVPQTASAVDPPAPLVAPPASPASADAPRAEEEESSGPRESTAGQVGS